jgi:hypothetical protein
MWELFYLCSIGSAFSVINFSKCQKCIQPIKTPLFDVVTSQPLCGTLVTSQSLCQTLVNSQTPLWNPCDLTNPSVEPL